MLKLGGECIFLAGHPFTLTGQRFSAAGSLLGGVSKHSDTNFINESAAIVVCSANNSCLLVYRNRVNNKILK